jgi:hypothetical protein
MGISTQNAAFWNVSIVTITVAMALMWSMVCFRRFELFDNGEKPVIKSIVGALIAVSGFVPWSALLT